MLINDIENKDELFNVIVGELRCHGIKYRKEKRAKSGQVNQFRAPIYMVTFFISSLFLFCS